MPESPDFDAIARQLAPVHTHSFRAAIAEQLRLVWNARGAADLHTLDTALTEATGIIESHETLDRLLRALDR